MEDASQFDKRPRRRNRRRRGTQRGILLLPHLITTANLALGFFAIVQSFAARDDPAKLDLAALAIVLAAVADAIDGRIARLTGSSSRFGMEYDSIADIVSFGVAPAMLAFAAGDLHELGKPGWVMAFTYTVCAALRLARFNVSPGRYKGRFEGMPSPAAAGMVAATQWFVSFLREEGRVLVDVPEWLVAASLVSLGLLMVSPIPYRSGKELDLRHSFGTLVLVVIALLLVIARPSETLFAIGIAYVLSGPVEWLWRRHTGERLEEVPAAPAHGLEPPPRG